MTGKKCVLVLGEENKPGPSIHRKNKDRVCTIIQETERFITVQFENGIKETIQKFDLENEYVKLIDMEGNEMGKPKVTINEILEEFIKLDYLKNIDDTSVLKPYAEKVASKLGITYNTTVTYYHKYKIADKLMQHWNVKNTTGIENDDIDDVDDTELKECPVCGKMFIPKKIGGQKNCSSDCTVKLANLNKKARKEAAKKVQEEIPEVQTKEEVKEPEAEVEYRGAELNQGYEVKKADDNDSLLIPDRFIGRVSGLRYQIGEQVTISDSEGYFYRQFNKDEIETFIRELQEASEICS